MKRLLCVLLFSMTYGVWAGPGPELWRESAPAVRTRILNQYIIFYSELKINPEAAFAKNNFFHFLLPLAWASEEMNCVYAGWPSKLVSGLCSSPKKHNPNYQGGSCGENQMQCQPLLFGSGTCVSVATPSERSLAFSNCLKSSKKSAAEVVAEIKDQKKEAELFEMMDLAEKICTSGKQATTAMCTRLKEALLEIKKEAGKKPEEEPTKGPPKVKPDLTLKPKPEPDPAPVPKKPEQQVLKDAVKMANDVLEKRLIPGIECVETGPAFARAIPRYVDWKGEPNGPDHDGAIQVYQTQDRNGDLRSKHFELKFRGPMGANTELERIWRFASEDDAVRDTYIWITDEGGSGVNSKLMESLMVIIPRKMKPHVLLQGDELHVVLPTGEKVIYDKNTRKLKSGALSEGPITEGRVGANIDYQGSGISIRLNKRGNLNTNSGSATITQNGKSCQVPAQELWSSETSFKYEDDSKLVDFLNRKCGKKFSI